MNLLTKLCPAYHQAGDAGNYAALLMYVGSPSELLGAMAVSAMMLGYIYNNALLAIEYMPVSTASLSSISKNVESKGIAVSHSKASGLTENSQNNNDGPHLGL